MLGACGQGTVAFGGRRPRVSVVRGCLGLLVVGLCGLVVLLGWSEVHQRAAAAAWDERCLELLATARCAKPIIDAVERFVAEHGEPPETLAELMPGLLADVPEAGPVSKPRPQGHPSAPVAGWYYERTDDSWQLYVCVRKDFCPKCPVSFGDHFVYRPALDYAQFAFGGQLEWVGDWGYYHE